MSKEIFISYSRKDIDKVKTIKGQIEMLTGADCWMDLEGIESGSPQFDEVIVRGINECHVFLFMLSKNSQESEFALNELELAIRKFRAAKDKRKVVLVNIDGCEMTDIFYLRYSRVDIIDWKDNPQQTKLIRDLCKWVGKKGMDFQEPENIDDDISRVQPVTSLNKKIRNIFKTIRLSWNNYPVRNKRNGCLIAVSIVMILIVVFVPFGVKEEPDFVLKSSDTKNSNVQEEVDTKEDSDFVLNTSDTKNSNVQEDMDTIAQAEVEAEINVVADKICTVNGVSFEMIPVEGGTFQMGATGEQGDDARSDEKPVHNVTLSDYAIGKTEVTQTLWKAVMGSNPSIFKGDNLPVENVSWNDCQEFISKLNQLTGKQFRLPTEAEWEYAARGGNRSKGYKYSGNNDIDAVAWYDGNSDKKKHPVATKHPNELGIYDMSGNVWEWCYDWHGKYSSSSQTNPTGASSGSSRVYRGGCWFIDARFCRTSYRSYAPPDYGFYNIGLRLVLSK